MRLGFERSFGFGTEPRWTNGRVVAFFMAYLAFFELPGIRLSGSPGRATGLLSTSGPGSFAGRPTVSGLFKTVESNVLPQEPGLPDFAMIPLLGGVGADASNRPG